MGKLRVTSQLLTDLLSAGNFEVMGAAWPDEKDRKAGIVTLIVRSPILPVREESAELPEVECIITEHRRVATIQLPTMKGV